MDRECTNAWCLGWGYRHGGYCEAEIPVAETESDFDYDNALGIIAIGE